MSTALKSRRGRGRIKQTQRRLTVSARRVKSRTLRPAALSAFAATLLRDALARGILFADENGRVRVRKNEK